PKVSGMRTSAERLSMREWSAKVARTHPSGAVFSSRQSVRLSCATTVVVSSNDPPGPKGTARSLPYDGGFEENQPLAPVVPDMSTPPRQGVGRFFGPLSTHTAT